MDRFPPKFFLVPVDFSPPSIAGIHTAARLARRWNARIELVHVCEEMPAVLSQVHGGPHDRAAQVGFLRILRERLESLAEGLPSCRVRVMEGLPRREIGEHAAKMHEGWVVMGSHGHGALHNLVLGSVTESILHASRVPVLVVREDPPPDWPRRVLVPVQFTPRSDAALHKGLEIAASLDAPVAVLHAAEEEEPRDAAWSALQGHLQRVLEPPQFARLERLLRSGRPDRCIVETAEESGFDLIVLAAHRRPFWRSRVLGTTADRILRHSPVPVLAVPSDEVELEEKQARLLARQLHPAG